MNACEMRRLEEMSLLEVELSRRGYIRLAGLDEAGRGCLAGPVVAAAVILPTGECIEGVRDSKLLTAHKREELCQVIESRAIDYGVGIVDSQVIDRTNILQATCLAIREALLSLEEPPDFLLIDALHLPGMAVPQLAIVKGDLLCFSIAAASILAKVTRDRLMWEYHRIYPHYNFLAHKGYGTEEHLRLLNEYGPCQIHRRSFRGVKEVYG